MKKRFTSLLIFMMPYLAAWSADGDAFSVTHNNVIWNFQIISEADKTCRAGVVRKNGNSTTFTMAVNVATSGSLTIPNSVNGYNVVEIGESAFCMCENITSITVRGRVTSIGADAFGDCSSLTSISFNYGSSLKNIGVRAFQGCSSLKSFEVPSGVTTIETSTFSGCSSLSFISLPNTLTSIGQLAFEECSSLSSISLPNNLKSIERLAFSGCSNLSSVSLPSDLTSIGDKAFEKCSSLIGIYIPNKVTNIGMNPFASCSSLNSIVVSTYNTHYDSRNNCNAIIQKSNTSLISGCKNTILHSDITSIGESAFEGCVDLTSVNMWVKIRSIGDNAFYGCSSIKSITIPWSVSTIGYDAFSYCSSLTSVKVASGYPPILESFTNSGNATLYVPSGCSSYYRSADNWNIFSRVVELSEEELSPSIYFANENVKAICVANWDCNSDGELSLYEAQCVTSLGTVFKDNPDITSFDELQYFTGLKTIGEYAFYDCYSLSSIVLPESLETIESDAFSGTSISTVYLPLKVSTIVGNPFDGEWDDCYECDADMYVRYPKRYEVSTYNQYFSSIDGVLYNKAQTKIIDVPLGISGTISIPSTVIECSDRFYFPDLERINVSAKTWYEMDFANAPYYFYTRENYDDELEDWVDVDIDLVYDGDVAIPYAGNITLPSTIKKIGSNVFQRCNITKVTIPNGVTSIGRSAFFGCSSLASVVSEIATPFAFGISAFRSIASNCSLTVPAGTKDAYIAAGWTEEVFGGGIVEMTTPETDIVENAVLPWGVQQAWEMKYMFFEGTDSEPEIDGMGHAWYEVDYDDNGWQTLSGPIANLDNQFSTVNTIWNNEGLGSSSYCLRRTFHMDQVDEQGYTFLSQHDDDLKVWINGELVVDAGFDGTLQCHHIPASLFHEGENTLAISVNDFGGEAFLDYSLGRLFFLQNVETGKYLNAGNEWGTHAVLADEPLPVQLYKLLDGSYTIFFPVGSYNQHLLFMDESMSDVYVDYAGQEAPACPYWNITDAGNGNYYIQMLNESDTYLGNDPDREPDNDVDGDVTSGKNVTWTLVPEGLHTQAQVDRLQELITQANALHIDTNKAQAVLDDENSTYTEMLAQILQVDGWINEGIWFEDEKVKELCVANWDTSEDGELSRIEAGTVADLGEVFKGNTEITSFNELQYFTGLTAIGDRAFSESSHLTSVQLPEGLERIGESAFDRTALETIQFPSTLTSVGATAFQACENLTSIDFNGCTATIEGDAFSWCPSLTEVVIPSNITLTGWFTFAGCRNLKTLIIEEGNPSENLQATFAYCFDSSLETVVLPSTAIMGENMFEGCSKLKSVTFLNGDPGEKHFANNFQGVPDDVLFVISEGTAENYLKRGYRNLSDKGALGKVRELFENQVNRISNDIVANVADGDKDALNAAISAAREIVETAEDYMTIYQQIDAIKDAAKAYLATAALTEDLDVTGAMITNPDNDYFDIGWTIGFLGMNNGWQNANYSNEDCTIDSFVESWRPGEALSDGRHSQTIKNLPAGKYRLDVKAIATWQDDPEQEVMGVSLFLGDQSTPLATANEKPQFFSVEFTNAETQDVEMGLKVENTTANWVALDDVRLYYLSDAVIEEPDNMLYVEETPSVLSGSKTELSISLKNEDAIIATDFYLQLPEGMSLDKVALNGSRSDGHQVTSQLNNDGYYHIVCYSSQNNAFKESDGELFCMTFSCASNVTAGTYQANVVNILMKDADKHNVAQPNFTISIEVPDLQLGDANEDRKIDIGDIVEVVDRIMQRPSETFNFAAANLHYDQKINALDLVVLVKLVLSQVVNQGAGPAPAMRKYLAMREAGLRRSSCADELHVADISIQPGESKPVSVELVNPDHAYNTIQFELALPSGLSIAKTSDDKFAVVPNPDRLTTDFTLEVNEIGESRYQFLVWTTNTEAVITGTSGELFAMTLTASADAETGMKQGVFSEQLFVIDEEGYEPADKAFNIRIGRLPGDANGDGYVTIADVMAVVNYILGNTPKDFDFDAANVNNDEVITIADAVSLVKMILEMP